MNRFVVVPVRNAEDVSFARYTVQASHAAEGACLVLDLLDAPEAACDDWDALLAEFERTARGNRQTFAVLWHEEPCARLAPAAVAAGLVRHASLGACLAESRPPAEGELHALVTLPSRLDYVPEVKGWLAAVVRSRHGESDAFKVEIIVDELGHNAVDHSPSSHNFFDVAFRLRAHEIEIDVTNVYDDSLNTERIMQRRLKSFDASGDYMGDRGRGLFLVARLADGMQIRSLPGERVCVSVLKRLGGGPGPGSDADPRA